MTPNWRGEHRHFDFNARYAINDFGFRADAKFTIPSQGKRYAVVGDSFAFGLGVNDDETFVHRLNESATLGATFLNFSVPGYSTDQEALLIEQSVFEFKPDVVMLVVYLANDLFDNLYPFPLQGNLPKPRFILAADGLQLNSVPQPTERKPAALAALDLPTVVLEANSRAAGLIGRLERHSVLARVAGETFFSGPRLGPDFAARFEPAFQLFDALVERIHQQCAKRRVRCMLALMAGKSFVTEPESTSGQYQEVLRRTILAFTARER